MTLPTHSGLRRRQPGLLGALAGFLCIALVAPERAAAQTEDEARAIFLYNFARFVAWPEAAFVDAGTPITIAVAGDAPVAKALDRYVKGKNANGRDLAVKQLDTAAGCGESQIVFVGDPKFAADVLTQIGGKPVLSVGDDENFLKAGGAIRLFAKDGKVLCAINVRITDAAGLKLSDKLVKASS